MKLVLMKQELKVRAQSTAHVKVCESGVDEQSLAGRSVNGNAIIPRVPVYGVPWKSKSVTTVYVRF